VLVPSLWVDEELIMQDSILTAWTLADREDFNWEPMKKNNDQNPVLRSDLDLSPVRGEDGGTMILLRDPFGLDCNGPLAFSEGALPLLSLLDGNNNAQDILDLLEQKMADAENQARIPLEAIQSFIDSLDEAFLLDNNRFAKARKALVDSFKQRPDRPAALAGASYPEDPDACRNFIDQLLDSGNGESDTDNLQEKDIVALVAPHIELRVGDKVYSAAYNTLRGRSYDRVIVLGVGHNMSSGLFSLTGKDFVTTLGTVPADQFAVKRLRQAAGQLASTDDFEHRSEHSIEFQVVLLQSVLESPFTLVPVLCGSLFEQLVLGDLARPNEFEELVPALDCLASMLTEKGSRTLLVAGVDLCHIGPKFGDRNPAIQIARDSKAHDRALLDHLTAQDVESFVAESRYVRDRYHVCGFSALSMLLEILPEGITGRELGYHLWHETPTQSAVSFAAAAFYRE
jgi:MEMO1 family protein